MIVNNDIMDFSLFLIYQHIFIFLKKKSMQTIKSFYSAYSSTSIIKYFIKITFYCFFAVSKCSTSQSTASSSPCPVREQAGKIDHSWSLISANCKFSITSFKDKQFGTSCLFAKTSTQHLLVDSSASTRNSSFLASPILALSLESTTKRSASVPLKKVVHPWRKAVWPAKSQHCNLTFALSIVSTFEPTVGCVFTTTPSRRRYRAVVFPALSRPIIVILNRFCGFPKAKRQSLERIPPIFFWSFESIIGCQKFLWGGYIFFVWLIGSEGFEMLWFVYLELCFFFPVISFATCHWFNDKKDDIVYDIKQ